MRTDEYRRIYELEETHWWYRGLRELILTFAVPTLNAANLVLDCGCGTGIVLKTFSKFTRVVGIDLSSEALSFCKFRKITSISKADTTNLPFQDEAFDTILSLDVLYHRWVDDDSSALSEYYRLLKPAGTLLLNLPAYRFLYGGHDLVVETKRRYTVGEIRRKVESAGLKIVVITYRNTLLFPLILLGRLIRSSARSDLGPLPKCLNTLLYCFAHFENRLLTTRALPFGGSVFCIAVKRGHPT